MDASDVLVERLIAWGVDTIFGLPGDGTNSVMEALRKKQDKIRFIHVRHEESAAFKWEQMVFEGNPEYQCDLFPTDFVALARALGAEGVRVDNAKMAGAEIERALAIPRPVMIEAAVDPLTAMLPPKITAEQAVKFTEALLRGEPNRLKIALTAASATVRLV